MGAHESDEKYGTYIFYHPFLYQQTLIWVSSGASRYFIAHLFQCVFVMGKNVVGGYITGYVFYET